MENTVTVKMISRSKLKELVYRKLEVSGDPEHIKPTLETALDAITELRLDSRVMSTNKDGKECLLTLMGSHVYTWHNRELIESVKECYEEVISGSPEVYKGSKEYILELDENDKKIFSTN